VAPAASGTIPPGGIGQPIAGFAQGNAYEVTDATTTPAGGLVAVGFAGTGEGYYGLHRGVVWTSPDGQTWQQTMDPALLDVSPTYVLAIGDSVYLFGEYESCSNLTEDECPDDPNTGTVLFRSTSGGPWEQVAQTTDIIQASFEGVATWNSSIVAWGSAADDNSTTTLWTSADALTWHATSDLAGLDPVDAVTTGGPGLIAFGSKFDDAIDDAQLVGATSTDGTHFTSTTVPPVTAGTVTGIAPGPGGYAAVGWAASEDEPSLGLTVFSPDGSTWTETTASDASFDNALVNDVHATANEYVAVGSTLGDDDMELQTGRVWVSGDGQSWRSLGDLGGQYNQYGASVLVPSGLYVFNTYEEDVDEEDVSDVKSTIYGWFVPNDHLTP